jgi:CubicO group peptidase (beta-lactamase class C family)
MAHQQADMRAASLTERVEAQLTAHIETCLDDAIARHITPGAVVLVARGPQLRTVVARGTTAYDHPGSCPVTSETVYDIASITKVFTATVALQLIETGELALDMPVAQVLPAMCDQRILVRHLLNHTSGLALRLSSLRSLTPDALVAQVCEARAANVPGTVVAYANVNSLLLGELICHVTGDALDLAIRQRVCEPLGLRTTMFNPPRGASRRIAPTEIDDAWRRRVVHGTVHDESAAALAGVAGHAGLFSDATDLWRFGCAWLAGAAGNDGLLGSAMRSLAITNHSPIGAMRCGLGWMLDRPTSMGRVPVGTYGHTGFTGTLIIIEPQSDTIVVILSNRTYPRRGEPAHYAAFIPIIEAAIATA